MRRADRLFQIIQLLRRRRGAVTAGWLGEQLDVSERTIYRDIRDLVGAGTPIEGAAGVGYALRRGYDLPPLMFDKEEIQALVLGARAVASHADADLARAAERVVAKVSAVLPKHLAPFVDETTLFAMPPHPSRAVSDVLSVLRGALVDKRKIRLGYERADGERSNRIVRPLGAFFWGERWTLNAWCELRDDFRNFRLDRVRALEALDMRFQDEPGRTLRDYLRTVDREGLLDP